MAAKSSPWLPSSYIKSTGWSHLHTGRLLVSPRRFLLLLVSELCTCPVLRLLTVSIRTMFLNICCAQKASYASPTILPLTKWVSSSWGMRYLKVVLLLLEFNGINNIFSLPLQLIEIDTFMNGDKYAKLQNLILKGAPAGSLLMFFPDSLDHDCKVQQLNSSFQGRGKIGFHLCCWNKK